MTARRTFLRRSFRAAAGAFAGGVVYAGAACTREPDGSGAGAAEAAGASGTPVRTLPPLARPRLRPWASDMVWLGSPTDPTTVAYVSMALRQVFVEYEYRDRASWLLRAHISVSTAHWRIPLPGDPPRQPITPGDEEREFEELSMREWDSSRTPEIDDVRIVLGAPGRRTIDFACVPLLDGSDAAWLSGGPFRTTVTDGSLDGASMREDFRILGTGIRHPGPACSTPGDAVQYVGWAHAE